MGCTKYYYGPDESLTRENDSKFIVKSWMDQVVKGPRPYGSYHSLFEANIVS